MGALLQALQQTQPEDVTALEREIERQWSLSGSNSVDLLFEKGEEAFQAEEFRDAVEHFSAVTEFAPSFAMGWFARSRALVALGYDGPAFEDLERALSIDPQNYLAILALGEMLEYFGYIESAIVTELVLLALAPLVS